MAGTAVHCCLPSNEANLVQITPGFLSVSPLPPAQGGVSASQDDYSGDREDDRRRGQPGHHCLVPLNYLSLVTFIPVFSDWSSCPCPVF